MTTSRRLAVAALALGLAGVPLTAASAHDGRGHHGRHEGHHHWRGDYGYRYEPYAHYRYRYAPVRYAYVRRPYTRVIYDDYYPYYPAYYGSPYGYVGYARPGLSVSVGYADRGDYGGYRGYYHRRY